MTSASHPASRLAESLDRVMLLEPPLQPRPDVHPPREDRILPRLYRAARRRVGGPLSDGAAAALLRLPAGGPVVITTGLVTPRIPRGETDGPPGAVVLARAVLRSRGGRVLLLSEGLVVPAVRAAADLLAEREGDGDGWRARLEARPFPLEAAAAKAAATHLLERHRPAAVLSVEKLGPNARGVIHNMRGQDVTATQARVEFLVAAAARRGLLTVGVGDRGNEIGLGGLLARPGACVCGCGGAIACAVPAAVPVAAFSSNWGAYAVAAALAARTGRPGLLHRPDTEGRILRRLVQAGVVDGVTGRAAPTVDGVALPIQQAVVGLLCALVAGAGRP